MITAPAVPANTQLDAPERCEWALKVLEHVRDLLGKTRSEPQINKGIIIGATRRTLRLPDYGKMIVATVGHSPSSSVNFEIWEIDNSKCRTDAKLEFTTSSIVAEHDAFQLATAFAARIEPSRR